MAQYHWQCQVNDGNQCLASFDGDEQYIKDQVKNHMYSSHGQDVTDDEALAGATQTGE